MTENAKMQSIEKLRDSLNACRHTEKTANPFDTYWITASACDMLVDEIEREIAERYIELPLDADGVPIHVGDKVRYGDGKICLAGGEFVKGLAFGEKEVYVTTDHNFFTRADMLVHVKKQDLEDVLERFIEDYDHWDEFADFERGESRNKLFAKYADEIRELLGVGE